MKKKIKLYFDGSCGPINPGGYMGYGFFLEDEEGTVLLEGNDFDFPHTNNSNNVAEYKALHLGLSQLLDYLDIKNIKDYELEVLGDSKLVIMQCLGNWKIKEGYYKEMALKTKDLLSYIEKPFFRWIPREENTYADELSNRSAKERGLIIEHPRFVKNNY
jgi:ribonuclease HI